VSPAAAPTRSNTGGGAGRPRGGVVAALLVVTALSMISFDLRADGSSPFAALRSVVAGALGPVERSVGTLVARASASDATTDSKVAALQAEVDSLTAQLRRTETDRRRVAELDALLRLSGAGQYRTVPALVIAVAPAEQAERTVTIDAGQSDGIATDMTVVNGVGLVGRVVATTSTTATVQLILDSRSQLGVRLEGSLQLAVARGNGVGLGLELLDRLGPLVVGARVVTFGSPDGHPFVAGVPVGELSRVRGDVGAQTRSAVLAPYVDFAALDLVAVIVEPPRTDPRDAVLPPSSGAEIAPTLPAGMP